MHPKPILRILLAATVVGCGASDTPSEPPPASTVAQIFISPVNPKVNVGSTLQLRAEARDAAGALLTQVPITWSSASPTVAGVSTDGLVTGVAPGMTTITASGGGRTASTTIAIEAKYDVDALGTPRFITHDYIELNKITLISRFRSGIGHDYADDVERCRSMKHYFQPLSTTDWGSVVISTPTTGVISAVQQEQTFGTQVRITPAGHPAATVILFHVKLDAGIMVGTQVSAGARLGTHISNSTMSDVAVMFDTPHGRRMVSYFDAMTDQLFATYQARGIAARSAMVISAAERNANPLTCNGESFADAGTLPNWVNLP